MAIVPDTADWTWVLERLCPECGLDTRLVTPDMVPAILRRLVIRWQEVLTGSDADSLRRRVRHDRWSTLEYGCHVRDVFKTCQYRLDLMLVEDAPGFPNWDQDQTAVEDRYGEQDPVVVAAQVASAGMSVAATFEGASQLDLERTGHRSDGATFTVATFGRYVLHDPFHHLYDIGKPMDPPA